MEMEKSKDRDEELYAEVGEFLDSLPSKKFDYIRSIVNLYLPQLQELHQVETAALYWYLSMVVNFLSIVIRDTLVSQYVSLDLRSLLFVIQIISVFPFLGYEIIRGLPARAMKDVIETEIMDSGLLAEGGRSVEQIMAVIANDQFTEQTARPVSKETLKRLSGVSKKKRSEKNKSVPTLGQLMADTEQADVSPHKKGERRVRRK